MPMAVASAVAAVSVLASCSRPPHEARQQPAAVAASSVDPAQATAEASPAAPDSGPSTAPGAACGDPGEITVFTAPAHPVRGTPMRVLFVSDRAIDAELA